MKPSWISCENCEDYWCIEHEKHVADCDCPGIEVWMENDVYPYISEEKQTE